MPVSLDALWKDTDFLAAVLYVLKCIRTLSLWTPFFDNILCVVWVCPVPWLLCFPVF